MGLKIMTGRRSAQLSQAVYQAIETAQAQGQDNLFLIVPEQFTLGAERALIEVIGQNGLSGVEVLSPKRLAVRVLKETGGLMIKVLDQHGRNMLMHKAMIQVQENLVMYKSSVQKSGFSQKISDLIAELKENETQPEDLSKVTAELSAGLLKQKLDDIRLIYQEYNLLLGEDRIDDNDLHQLFVEKIPQASFVKNASFWIDGFQNFSAQDYQMIRNLMVAAVDLIVALPYAEGSPDANVFDLTANTMKRLKEIGITEEVSFSLIPVNEKEICAPEICFLEKNLFAYPPAVWAEAAANIKLFQSQNVWEEVENGARAILRLIREEAYDYRDIVVLTGIWNFTAVLLKGFLPSLGFLFSLMNCVQLETIT
ncbi:hypothetical protein Q5O14_13285 [Eubacteriaceae bacterium ES2]|nr:hypothetical protein Q5O14_13285 [Eubacteriaceae bacterium ES2]